MDNQRHTASDYINLIFRTITKGHVEADQPLLSMEEIIEDIDRYLEAKEKRKGGKKK